MEIVTIHKSSSQKEGVVPMSKVGKPEVRVDGYDKATGRTKYYEDRMPKDALYVRIKHADIPPLRECFEADLSVHLACLIYTRCSIKAGWI